jgi:acyl-CoA thioesterase-2
MVSSMRCTTSLRFVLRRARETSHGECMASAVQELVDILDLEPLELNLFRGRSPQSRWQRVFGGQVIGQALVAACRTVDDVTTRPPHSLHAYFLLGGDPKVPIIYDVDRIRDGKSFTTRNVKARQHGHAIFSMSVSFHVHEEGLSHQFPMPDVPKPDALPDEAELKRNVWPKMPEPVRRYYERERPIELRPVEYGRYLGEPVKDGRFHVWMRATGRLPDEPAIHQCVLAYASDMMLLDAALIPHQRSVFSEDIMAASLDHALWFHRPFRADEWLLYAQDSPNLAGSRGFARGLIFSLDGTLVASVAQEGLLRQRRTPAS